MRFNFTPEEQAFRQEVKDFLAAEWTEDHDLVPGSEEAHAQEMGMRKKLADKAGWHSPGRKSTAALTPP